MNFKILVFEHDGLWLDVYKAFLSGADESVEAHYTDTPEAAMEYLKAHEVDFVVIDMDYPSFDGFDFLDMLKKETSNWQKPFLIATEEFKDEYFFTKAYKFGAVDYVIKSNGMDRLYNRIKLIERLKKLYEESATSTRT